MGLPIRCFCYSLFALFSALPATAAELKIAVASNFAETAEVLVNEFAQRSDHQITLLVGSSGKHTAQIQYGLAVDVFMAADAARPKLLEQRGFTLKGSRQTYAQGRLVVWSAESDFFETASDPRDASAEVTPERLKTILNSSAQSIVSIANPKVAPYGFAAQQVLNALAITPRLVNGESVAQAFQFVNGGGAQLGLIALAQVKDLDVGSYLLVPEVLHDPINQQLGIINDSEAARQWRDFVLSEASQNLIASRGYRRAAYSHGKVESD